MKPAHILRLPTAALTVTLLTACATTPASRSAPPEAAAALDALHAAASRADGPAYFGLFTPDAVFIGTDVGERWTVPEFRAYAEPHFAQGKGWTYTPRERWVTLAPVACRCVAWFDEVLDSESYGTSRGTGVLVRGSTGWKVAQYALSFPIPNDIAKELTDRIKAHEAQAPPSP